MRWPTWRGCLRGQRATRSTPRYWPQTFFTDTAPGRRAQLRIIMAVVSTTVPRSPRALRPVENGPTALGARPRWKSWCGFLRGRRATRSTPRRWPRLFFANISTGRQLRFRNGVATVFDSRGTRGARASHCGESANRPRSTRALVDLAWLSSLVNSRRAPSHAVGRGSSSTTPRQVGDGIFDISWTP